MHIFTHPPLPNTLLNCFISAGDKGLSWGVTAIQPAELRVNPSPSAVRLVLPVSQLSTDAWYWYVSRECCPWALVLTQAEQYIWRQLSWQNRQHLRSEYEASSYLSKITDYSQIAHGSKKKGSVSIHICSWGSSLEYTKWYWSSDFWEGVKKLPQSVSGLGGWEVV